MVGRLVALTVVLCSSLSYFCLGILPTNYFKANRKELIVSSLYHIEAVSNIDKLYFAELLYLEYGAKEPFPFASSICDSLLSKIKSHNLNSVSYEFVYKTLFSVNTQNCELSKEALSVFLEAPKNEKTYKSFYYCRKLEEISDYKCSLTSSDVSAEPTTTSKIFESIYLIGNGDSKERLESLLSTIPFDFIVSGSLLENMELSADLLLLYHAILKDKPGYLKDNLQKNVVEFISRRYLHCSEPTVNYFKASLANLLEKLNVHIPAVNLDMNSLVVDIQSPETSKLLIHVDPMTMNPLFDEYKSLRGLKDVVLSGLKCGENSYKINKEKNIFQLNEDKAYVLDIGAQLKDKKPEFHMSSCNAEIELVYEKSGVVYSKSKFDLYFNILTDAVPYESMSIWIPSRKQKIDGLTPSSKLSKELSLGNYEVMEIEVKSNSDVYFVFSGPHTVAFKSLASASEPNIHTLKLDLNKVDRSDFHFVSGKYELKVMPYSDEAGPFPNPWVVGTVNIQFSEPEERYRAMSHSYEGLSRKIIEAEIPVTHQGSKLFAICGIFAVITIATVGSVWVAKCDITLCKPYQISLPKAIFFMSFGSIFGVYLAFWIQLDMFHTIYIVTPLLLLALVSINYMF